MLRPPASIVYTFPVNAEIIAIGSELLDALPARHKLALPYREAE